MIGILSYKTWLIEYGFASRMAPILIRALEQGNIETFFKQNRESNDKIISNYYAGYDSQFVFDWHDGVAPYHVFQAANNKKVAVITMLGAITKNGDACSYGMRDHQNQLRKIAKNDEISGVVIHFNNAPGGSHDGTPEMYSFIKNYKKPILGFVDGMAASAHYYMAAATKHIMMNSLTDSEVGSIGSLIISQNIQNMVTAGNWPSTEILRAPQSINKALFNYIEPLNKDVRKELDEELRQGVDKFIADVKLGRPALAEVKDNDEMFTGKMYPTDIAIGKGLADSKGSLFDAINKVAQGITVKATENTPSKNSNSMTNFRPSIFFGKGKVAKTSDPKKEASEKKAAEEGAAEETSPRWTKDLVFNTDGTGDGAFCIHADANGNDREFETKTDGNTGNEPPTDPNTTEDDNWSVVQAASENTEDNGKTEKKEDAVPTVTKLNAALKVSQENEKKLSGEVKTLTEKVSSLEAANTKLESEKKELQTKLEAAPAATAIEVTEEKEEQTTETPEQRDVQQVRNVLNDHF